MTRFLLIISCAFALAACSSRDDGGATSTVTKNVKEILAKRKAERAEPATPAKPAPPAAQPTRAALRALDKKLIMVGLPSLGYQNAFTQVSLINGFANYRSPDNLSVSLKAGALRETRGLPYDLMETAFAGDARTYRFLKPTNVLSELRLSCETVAIGPAQIQILDEVIKTQLTEMTCKSPTHAFKNSYWRDGRGQIVKSQEWIGPGYGFAVIEALN